MMIAGELFRRLVATAGDVWPAYTRHDFVLRLAHGDLPEPALIERIGVAIEAAGLVLLDFMACDPSETGQPRACAAAVLAEDLAPPAAAS